MLDGHFLDTRLDLDIQNDYLSGCGSTNAGVVKLVDARDLKSPAKVLLSSSLLMQLLVGAGVI